MIVFDQTFNILIISVGVYVALKKHHKSGPSVVAVPVENPAQQAALKKREKAMKSQTRAMLLMAVTFIVTSSLMDIVALISSATNEAYKFCLFFLYLNSLLNTLIYTSKVPAIKNSLFRMLRVRNAGTVSVATVPSNSQNNAPTGFSNNGTGVLSASRL